MPKRKTKPGEIRNPEHYFNRYIAREILKDREKTADYYEKNTSLEELQTGGNDGVKKNISLNLSTNTDGEELERHLSETSLLAWIDQIENPRLYQAVSNLPKQHQILLSLRYQLCRTQAETAIAMGMTQQAVSKCEARLLKKIQDFLK